MTSESGRVWTAGDLVQVRSIWDGRIHSAHPAFVVEDTGDVLATYLAPGQLFKRAFHIDGAEARVPHGDWVLTDEEWRVPALRFFLRGQAHSALAFLGGRRAGQWYVNLEDPPKRTARGIDTRDHMVDVWFSLDRREYTWKDTDELVEAEALGVVALGEAEAIRAEGERVIAQVLGRSHRAINDRWHDWTPPPEWGIPELPSGWEHLERTATSRPIA